MTVAADLATATGIQRRLFLKVDGFEPILWQGAAINGYSRSGLVCLIPGMEMSTTFDCGEMWQTLDAMSFKLIDIKDSAVATEPSYFGKRLSPALWDSANTWQLDFATTPQQTLAANANTMVLQNADGLNATGETLYIGNEAFSYTGINSDGKTLTGVTRGLYPCCTAANWGYTYAIPQSTDINHAMIISRQPYSWYGRRVALYCATNNPATGWTTEANALLLWVGRISNSIKYEPSENCWILSCNSILSDIEKEVATDLREMSLAPVINIGIADAMSFKIVFTLVSELGTMYFLSTTITMTGGPCDAQYLVNEINNKISVATWKDHVGNTQTFYPGLYFYIDQSKISERRISYHFDRSLQYWPAGGPALHFVEAYTFHSVVNASGKTHVDNYLWNALGFSNVKSGFLFSISTTWSVGSEQRITDTAPNPYACGYQPCATEFNGTYLYTTETQNHLISDQGDSSTDYSYIVCKGAINADGVITGKNSDEDLYSYFQTYAFATQDVSATLKNTYIQSGTVGRYTLSATSRLPVLNARYVVRYNSDEEPVKLKQCYIPECVNSSNETVGPYTMILKILSSTGTQSYNGTYDIYPKDFGLGIESALIDSQSFLDADAELYNDMFADRRFYVIDKSISAKELIQREAKIFGKAVCWRNGKLRVTDILSNPVDKWTVTISDSNYSDSTEKVSLEYSPDTVINRYNCKIGEHPIKRKTLIDAVINDIDSIIAIGARAIDIEHPGVYTSDNLLQRGQTFLSDKFGDRYFRHPSLVITRTISPVVLNKIEAGDIVKYTSSYVHDPMGSGTKTTSCFAIVLNVNRNYATWTGQITLLLLTRFQRYGEPWAPSALVNTVNPTNGWDPATQQLILCNYEFGNSATDDKDGFAFLTGQKIQVYQRDWDDVGNILNVLTYGPYTVASTFEADGTDILTLSDANTGGGAMPALSSSKEYVVEYADYETAVGVESMRDDGTWQAATTTEQIGYWYPVNDLLNNSSAEYTADEQNGDITETSFLNIQCNATLDCTFPTAPIAYYSIPTVSTGCSDQRFLAKVTGVTASQNFAAGITLWTNRDNAYIFTYGDDLWPQNVTVDKYVGGAATLGLASTNIGMTPSSATPLTLAIFRAPTSGELSFYYSTDGGVSWGPIVYTTTEEFTPSRVGLVGKVWATFPTANVFANFGLLREIEFSQDLVTTGYPIYYYRWG